VERVLVRRTRVRASYFQLVLNCGRLSKCGGRALCEEYLDHRPTASGRSCQHSQIPRKTQRQQAALASPHRQKPKAQLVRSCGRLALFRLGNTTSHGGRSCPDALANVDSTSRRRHVHFPGTSPCRVVALPPLPVSRTPANKRGHRATTKAQPPSSNVCETDPWTPSLSDAADVRSAPPQSAPPSPAPATETKLSPRSRPLAAPPQTTARLRAESPQTYYSGSAPLSPPGSQTKSMP
jgi:hypothetical protein